MTLSIEQSILLATRCHLTDLRFRACQFGDGGSAFVDALQNRTSSLHVLQFGEKAALNDDNWKRLVQLDNIKHLLLPHLSDEVALLPFSAPVESLYYEIASSSIS